MPDKYLNFLLLLAIIALLAFAGNAFFRAVTASPDTIASIRFSLEEDGCFNRSCASTAAHRSLERA